MAVTQGRAPRGQQGLIGPRAHEAWPALGSLVPAKDLGLCREKPIKAWGTRLKKKRHRCSLAHIHTSHLVSRWHCDLKFFIVLVCFTPIVKTPVVHRGQRFLSRFKFMDHLTRRQSGRLSPLGTQLPSTDARDIGQSFHV